MKKNGVSVDRDTQAKRTWRDWLTPLLASAFVAGLVTTFLGGWLSARAQLHQLRVDRRISALKEYATSCYEYNRHLVAQSSNLRWAAGTVGHAGKEDFLRGQLQAIDRELVLGQTALAALKTNVAVVNALYQSAENPLEGIRFGPRDPPPPNDPQRAARVAEVLELFKTNLDRFGNRCDESVSRLAKQIED